MHSLIGSVNRQGSIYRISVSGKLLSGLGGYTVTRNVLEWYCESVIH